jgi:DNA-binding MarR family transcriptional regulator
MSQPAPADATPPLDFGVLLELLGFQVRRTQLRIYEDFARDAPIDGITPGLLAILVFIDNNPGLTQQRLCESLGIDKSTLAVTLHRLCDRGLVKRIRSRRDRRENALELTDKGDKVMRSMLAHVANHERRIARRLTRAERHTLMELLRKVAR